MGKFRAAAGLAAIAVASLGLAGAAALAATTTHSGAAGVTRGMPARARAAADRIPGTATVYVANAGSGTVTPIAIADNRAGPAIKVGDNPLAIAITPDGKTA
jgi:YVTN family beta-propeller protein